MKFTEDTLISYTKPLSDTEDQKCVNAINMVKDALTVIGFSTDRTTPQRLHEDTASYFYKMRSSGREITIFVQGSYANGTNVKTESDVDIAVVLESTFRYILREGVTRGQYGIIESSDSAYKLKDDVVNALQRKFGSDVKRKDKSVYVQGNGYRVDADVVPSQRYRDFRNDFSFSLANYIGGIIIFPDSGGEIINFPEQHIANGKKKNVSTSLYYKKVVRIIKKFRYIMQDLKLPSADNVSSFGIESLLYNIPDDSYTKYQSYKYVVENIIDYLVYDTTRLPQYVEANGIKKLCPTSTDINNYTRFITDLKAFYQYE